MLDSYLLDNDFLIALDSFQHREVFARITALTTDNKPIEYIEGKITQGSINVDGSSVVQRTCNLTMVTNEVDINNFYWGIKTQFKLEIGLLNKIDMRYPDLIWFPQGQFIVNNFNTSISTNNCSITISGKDKMCKLNGDLGGNLPASIDFGKEEFIRDTYEEKSFNNDYEYISHTYYVRDGYKEYFGHFNPEQKYYVKQDGRYVVYKGKAFYLGVKYYIENYILATEEYDSSKIYYIKNSIKNKIDLPLKTIIKEMVHAWGGEPYSNIIINNLDDYGLEQLIWRNEAADLYCLRRLSNDTYTQGIVTTNVQNKGRQIYIVNNDGNIDTRPIYLNQLIENAEINGHEIHLEKGVDSLSVENPGALTHFALTKDSTEYYTIMRISYGQDCGYRICDLIYAGDLISSIGETCTSILDKIKTMLGDYEYFYNIDGQFVFQRKKTYVNTTWNSIIEMPGERRADPAELSSAIIYNFIGNKITTQISNNPVLNNAKNDYSVWGVRKGITGIEIPVHARFAIDKKPIYYKRIDGKIFATKEGWQKYKQLMLQYAESNEAVGLSGFTRSHIPDNIQIIDSTGNDCSDDWWDLKEWAEYYRFLTGYYPVGPAHNFSTESFHGSIRFGNSSPSYSGVVPITNSQRYRDANNTWQTEMYWEYNPNNLTITFPEMPVLGDGGFIIDYYANNNSFESAEHSYLSCEHQYQYFLDAYSDSIKSLIYKPYLPDNTDYTATEISQDKYNYLFLKNPDYIVDWREIIYQMAQDYFKYSNADTIDNETTWMTKDIFLQLVGENNPVFYPTGMTGYEPYYTDIQGFWRQLYNPGFEEEGAVGKQARPQFTWSSGYYDEVRIWRDDRTGYSVMLDWYKPLIESVTVPFYCMESAQELAYFEHESTANLAPDKQAEIIRRNNLRDQLKEIYLQRTISQEDIENDENITEFLYWNHTVYEAPETLNFWIDFLDDDTELASISKPVIGDRTKVVNDNKVTSIYFKQVPELIFTSSDDELTAEMRLEKGSAYSFISYDKDLEQCFSISYRGKSAKDEIDNLLYQHSYCTENISITSIPIYHLQPNTRIFVEDVDTGISGEYIMTKFTIPLTYNGTMSITANKAPTRIY